MSAKSCGRISFSLTVPCTLRVSFPGYSCAPVDVLVPLCRAQVWGESVLLLGFLEGHVRGCLVPLTVAGLDH